MDSETCATPVNCIGRSSYDCPTICAIVISRLSCYRLRVPRKLVLPLMRQSLRLAQQSLNPRLGLHHRARLRRDPTKPLLRSVCHTACSDCGRKMPKQKRNCGRKVGVVSLSRNCSEITAHAHSHKHTHTHNPARVHAHAQAHTHTHTHTHTLVHTITDTHTHKHNHNHNHNQNHTHACRARACCTFLCVDAVPTPGPWPRPPPRAAAWRSN